MSLGSCGMPPPPFGECIRQAEIWVQSKFPYEQRHAAMSVWGSRLCENSDVELARREFVSTTLNKKRTALAVVVEGGKGRKQFCAFSARARFHTAWVKLRRTQCEQMSSGLLLKADIAQYGR